MTTSKLFLIRCVLDTEEDVVRDILVHPSQNLHLMHLAILHAFGIDAGEMSSFFRSNEDWEQGEEISMMDFDAETGKNALEGTGVGSCFEDIGERMLFVYDFLNLWTFYLELIDMRDPEEGKTYPRLVGKVGQTPSEPPAKNMESSIENEDVFDEEDEDQWY